MTDVHRRPPPMPPMPDAPTLSYFEYWPRWLFYPPVWVWSLLLMLRYRSMRAPLVTNPSIAAGGLVGESKSAVLDLVAADARCWFAPHIAFDRGSGTAEDDLARLDPLLATAGLSLPLVAKPDLGCRGAGVRPVRSRAELRDYLAGFPAGARLVVQRLIDWEGEAGVMWARQPGERQGRIISLTLKYFPHVIGNGRDTLRQLIMADPRAGRLAHLYLSRHRVVLDDVVPAGRRVRLAFAGSHSRGAIFRDGTHLVTPAMEARFDAIAAAIPEFWFGRFDVRFERFEDLAAGTRFRVVEVNGAGAEATHIWDSRMTLGGAYAALFRQWALVFALGDANRKRGHRPEPMLRFLNRWLTERRLTPRYPDTA